MSSLHQWVALSAAVMLFFALQSAYWWARGRRRGREDDLRRRLRGQQELREGGEIRIRSRERAAGEGRWMGSVVATRARLAVVEAGIDMGFAQLVVLSGALVLLVVLLVSGMASGLGGGVAGALVALGLQQYVLRRRDTRLRAMNAQLPRMLEVMVFSLRAGKSLEEAIRSASDEVAQPLAGDLRRCYDEYRMGRPIEQTLQQMRARWPSLRALYAWVEAVAVLKRTGGNLVEVMESLIDTLHAQSAHESRHRALTSEGRLSAMILIALPLLSFVGQAVFSSGSLGLMFGDDLGQSMLILATGLWFGGAMWVAKLSRPGRAG